MAETIEQPLSEKERKEAALRAFHGLLESNNLTGDEKELVKELYCNTETKYEVEGIDTKTLEPCYW